MALSSLRWNSVPSAEQLKTPDRARSPVFYVPELDTLRFFAFLGVFVYHSFHPQYYLPRYHVPQLLGGLVVSAVQAGAFGVDLFFVLSAYLITELLLRERERLRNVDVYSFYIRRILRIWPLYIVLLLITCGAGFVWPSLRYPRYYLVAYSLMLGNFAAAIWGSPPRGIGPLGSLGPLWSISIEEQFYLFWPLAVRRFEERVLARIALVLLAVASVSRLVFGLLGLLSWRFWFITVTRLDPIAFGILICIVLRGGKPTFRLLTRIALGLVGVTTWIAAARYCGIVGVSNSRAVLGPIVGYPAVALGAGSFLLAGIGTPPNSSRLFQNEQLRLLGKISYGLYMYHMVAIWVCYTLMGPTHGLWIPVSLALTIVSAYASYRWFESPFLHLKQRFTHVESHPV